MIAPSPQQRRDRQRWLRLQGTLAEVYRVAGFHHPVVRAARRATEEVYGSKALKAELACDRGQL